MCVCVCVRVRWGTGWLMDRASVDVPSFANALLSLPRPFELLLSLLEGSSDPRVPLLSAAVLASLLSTSLAASSKTTAGVRDSLPMFYRYLSGVTKSGDPDQYDLAIRSYVALLRNPYARAVMWEMKEETVGPLLSTLEEAAAGTGGLGGSGGGGGGGGGGGSDRAAPAQGGVPLQLLYHVLLAIWELTFDGTVSEEINGLVARHSPLATRPLNSR